jgi:putative DNA primase/helicase
LANICADLPSAHLAGTSTFKALTGGDAIEAEHKFRDSFTFEPFARLVFSANSPPRSSDGSDGFFDRWLVVPFDARFRGTKQEISRKELDARLSSPRELSGLLNKAVAAWQGIQRCGGKPTEPESVKAAWAEFRAMTDPLTVWLDQFTVDDPDAMVPRTTLRVAYDAACNQAGRQSLTETAFGRAFKKSRPNIKPSQRTLNGRVQWCYVGIGFRDDSATSSHGSWGSRGSLGCPLLVTNRRENGFEGLEPEVESNWKQDRANPVNPVNCVYAQAFSGNGSDVPC